MALIKQFRADRIQSFKPHYPGKYRFSNDFFSRLYNFVPNYLIWTFEVLKESVGFKVEHINGTKQLNAFKGSKKLVEFVLTKWYKILCLGSGGAQPPRSRVELSVVFDRIGYPTLGEAFLSS